MESDMHHSRLRALLRVGQQHWLEAGAVKLYTHTYIHRYINIYVHIDIYI